MSHDDEIEMRIRYWPSVMRYWPLFVRVEDRVTLMLCADGSIARVDGGDPGDEDDGGEA